MRRRDLIAILGATALARPARAAGEMRKLGVILSTGKDDPVHSLSPRGRRGDFC